MRSVVRSMVLVLAIGLLLLGGAGCKEVLTGGVSPYAALVVAGAPLAPPSGTDSQTEGTAWASNITVVIVQNSAPVDGVQVVFASATSSTLGAVVGTVNPAAATVTTAGGGFATLVANSWTTATHAAIKDGPLDSPAATEVQKLVMTIGGNPVPMVLQADPSTPTELSLQTTLTPP